MQITKRRLIPAGIVLAVLLAALFVFMPRAAWGETVGAFEVTGGENGTDYEYVGGTLTIKTGTALTIKNIDMSTAATDTIAVADGVSADITLAGVNIDVSGTPDACAFKIADDSKGNVKITLADGVKNTLKSGENCAGLQKNGASSTWKEGRLTIEGAGALEAIGGDNGAGIGGGNGGKGTWLYINGGTITAAGGSSGAGIGGGCGEDGYRIYFNGGSIKAVGGDSANNIGGGKGKGATMPYQEHDELCEAYLFEIDNSGDEPVEVNGVPYTPINHRAVDSADGKLYLYLSSEVYYNKESYVIKVGDKIDEYILKDYDTDPTWVKSTKISSAEELQKIGNDDNYPLDGAYILNADITIPAPAEGEKSNWTPIGSEDKPFTGRFNGNGHTVSGIVIDDYFENDRGLFGVIDGGNVVNLGVMDCKITGSNNVGGIAGSVKKTYITNCYVSGNIKGSSYVGGIVGKAVIKGSNAGYITSCSFDGTLSGRNGNCGGIVGYVETSGISAREPASFNILSCYVIANISASYNVGGLVGAHYSNQPDYAWFWIGNCYLSGRVTGNNKGAALGSYCTNKVNVDAFYNYEEYTDENKEDYVHGCSLKYLCLERWDGGSYTEEIDGSFKKATYTFPGIKGGRSPISGTAYYYNNGTDENPDWQRCIPISNADELQKIGTDDNYPLSMTYILVEDITLDPPAAEGESNWTPIGSEGNPFTGRFEGNGHTISGMVIYGESRLGLFGRTSGATILNLGVVNCKIDGFGRANRRAGGIVGDCGASLITNCYVTGEIKGYWIVGGIVGEVNSGTIEKCSFNGTVCGEESVGGIAGAATGATIQNCYAVGDLSVAENADRFFGGIAGCVYYGLDVNQCYFSGNIINPKDEKGAIVGGAQSGGSILTNCYYNNEEYTYEYSVEGATGLTLKELCADKLPAGFSEDIWNTGSYEGFQENGNFGRIEYTMFSLKNVGEATSGTRKAYNFGTEEAPDWAEYIEINSADDFQKIGADPAYPLSGNYVLMTDIALDPPTAEGGSNWTPIGTSSKPFTGKFSGNGHTVSGVVINTSEGYQGLFVKISGGTVTDLSVVDCEISGDSNVGGIAGQILNVTIRNCYVSGKISGAGGIGGIAGNAYCTNNIVNCGFSGAVSGQMVFGGIVGANDEILNISRCYFNGTAEGVESGAIVGRNDSVLILENCYYNTDFHTGAGNGATGMTTAEMTGTGKGSLLAALGEGWQKADNDTESGKLYYPVFGKASTEIYATYTPGKVTLKSITPDPVYGDDVEIVLNIGKAVITSAGITADVPSAYVSAVVVCGGETFALEAVDGSDGEYRAVLNDLDIGDHTAVLTLNGSDEFYAQFCSDVELAEFTISKAEPQVSDFTFISPSDVTFDGEAKKAKATTDRAGMGEITVNYYDSEGNKLGSAPVNAGTYTVKIDVAEGGNYKSAEGITDTAWKFTIEKAKLTIPETDIVCGWNSSSKEVTIANFPDNAGKIGTPTIAVSGDSGIIIADSISLANGVVSFDFSKNTADNIGDSADIRITVPTQNYEDLAIKISVTLNAKQDQDAPAKPDFAVKLTVNGDNGYTAAIVTELSGVEYSFDGVSWSNSNTKLFGHGEKVVGYIRFAETDEKNASGSTASDSVITGHGRLAKVDEVKPTCTVDGSRECWVCEEHSVYFSDENGADRIDFDDIVIPATGHKWATEWSSDEHEHWHKCENCREIRNKAAHISSGAATETTPETCTICGYVITPATGEIAAPVISPNGGTFSGSQTVQITCAADGAEIYYTTDGTNPTTASTKYTGKFTVNSTTTVKAIAVKYGMRDSAIVTATFIKKSSGGASDGPGGSSRPSTPAEKKPSLNGVQKSWSDIAADLAKLPYGGTVVINMNGATEVPADVIKAIKDRNVNVEFVADSARSWIVDGSEITAVSAADLSMLPGKADKSALRGVIGADFQINGIGVPADLKLTFRKEFAGQFANLYKLTDGRLAFQNCVKINENGIAVISGAEAKGEYVVMVCEFSDRPGDMNNDGILNAMDASAILKNIVGLESGKNPIMADFNGDGSMNAIDASAILKRIVGLA